MFGVKVREASGDGWTWQRRHSGYSGQKRLNMELPDRRKQERSQRRFMDAVNEGMLRVGVTEEDTKNRVRWR